MRQRELRLPVIGALVVALGLIAGASAPPVRAASGFWKDTYFTAGYERQVDSRTCTAASTAMMLNFIARRDLKLDQLGILAYEQPRDALKDSVQRGSDPLGWSKALTHYAYLTGKGPFTYRWEAYATEASALKRAANQLVRTNRPVGLLVANGTHAMVMTGFDSTADPRQAPFTLNGVWVSDPDGATRKRYGASSSPLDRYLETDATKQYDEAWYGRYVVIIPIN
jgi:hypothetical protein